jgi:type II secretory pathway component PulF
MTEAIVIKNRVKQAIHHVKVNVSAGKKLSDGLKDHRDVIPPIMIKIIEAGERSGALDHAMLDVSTFIDYQVSARLKTVTALIEPFLLVVVGGLIGGMMMAIIAPIYGLISQVGR